MKIMTVSELKQHLNNKDVCLVDVREPDEYAQMSIQGAYLIPLDQVCCEALPTTTKPLVIHCRSGKRSAMACERLLTERPDLEVYSLEGGILAWHAAGYDVC
ncbi:MAG: rhodanese-like domain-containing protein [Legionellaceae bacterium]